MLCQHVHLFLSVLNLFDKWLNYFLLLLGHFGQSFSQLLPRLVQCVLQFLFCLLELSVEILVLDLKFVVQGHQFSGVLSVLKHTYVPLHD